ncbi:Dicer-like protein 4 [Melia azedarach]|uniref:Dicer-like protein 4 n=1 Tax=Melia azedarach TaxID=155640 RepID=A0ACC1Y4B9_MELAZ|nr:Dicer-like protein 4 [Melia azedarach]
MEKKTSDPDKFKLNLKHLPPIDPYSISYPQRTQQMKYENPSCRIVPRGAKPKPGEEKKVGESDGGEKLKVGDVSDCLTKHIDPNSTGGRNFITKNSEKSEEGKVFHQTDSKNEGAPNKISAKSKLLEVCVANNWKSPLFDCCKEEGPSHMKLYTFKVTLVIQSSNMILECFGAPQSKKKTAAEHAAEGALWYLKHLGYFPIKKRKN